MQTAVAVEIDKTGFPQRLAKRLLAFRTVRTGSAAIRTNRRWPNQMIKVGQMEWTKSSGQMCPPLRSRIRSFTPATLFLKCRHAMESRWVLRSADNTIKRIPDVLGLMS